MKIPRHKNVDRYVITRMIEDYPSNRKILDSEQENPPQPTADTEDIASVSRYNYILRLRLECEAVERALAWSDRQPHAETYRELLKMVYWKKTHTCYGACYNLEISRREYDRFLDTFRAIVAASTGRLIPV